MKNSTISSKLFLATTIVITLILTSACNSPSNTPNQKPDSSSDLDGTYEYLSPLQGQSILIDGRYVYLYGQDSLMTGEAGTYQTSGDTVINFVTYSTDKELIGNTYMWKVNSTNKDTFNVVVMDNNGAVTGNIKSIKRN